MEWTSVFAALLYSWQACLSSAQQNPDFSSLSSECVQYLTKCEPTISSCAIDICSLCTSLSITPSIEPCCAAATPVDCFSSYVEGVTITATSRSGSISTIASPTTSIDSSALACISAYSIISYCEASTPGFTNLAFSSQATCLCSTSGTFAPGVYDGYWSTCLAWASTASPGEYSEFGPTGGGDVVRTPCQNYAASTSSAGVAPNSASAMTTLPATLPMSSSFISATGSSSVVSHGGAAGKSDMDQFIIVFFIHIYFFI